MITLTPKDWENLDEGLGREWLLTNGLGGYACGTIVGANTRRYHGLLVAATSVPTQRMVLLSKIDEELTLDNQTYKLGVNEWSDGSVEPRGDTYLQQVSYDDYSITFSYVIGKSTLTKTIAMGYGQNITFITYKLTRPEGAPSGTLWLRPLINLKDHHQETREGVNFNYKTLLNGQGFAYQRGPNSPELYLQIKKNKNWVGQWVGQWALNFHHRVETERGLDDTEDLFIAHTLKFNLPVQEPIILAASLGTAGEVRDWQSPNFQKQRLRNIQKNASSTQATANQLLDAADQFIVARPSVEKVLPEGVKGQSVIAGYPWFTDWGRDTMIALPGLTLSTHRYEETANILRTFVAYLDQGMLPNRFPDSAETPEYNTADAALWLFQAVYTYHLVHRNPELVKELFPKLEGIISWHIQGTRYGIKTENDLLNAGEPGVQLTWMDVKIGDLVVTPRWGKPVEINALWCNALGIMAQFMKIWGMTSTLNLDYAARYASTRQAFNEKFWYEAGGYLYDVIDTTVPLDSSLIDPQNRDYSLRPNQLLALSLPFGPLAQPRNDQEKERARKVIAICEQELLTPVGLRTLNKDDSRYKGRYTGGVESRDTAYHNGTVWPWLIGPFAEAHYNIYGDKATSRKFLEPLIGELKNGCIGTLAEVYDGDEPHRPLGCFAQAWSVAEVLRMWLLLS